jgi:hypothetical protein
MEFVGVRVSCKHAKQHRRMLLNHGMEAGHVACRPSPSTRHRSYSCKSNCSIRQVPVGYIYIYIYAP